MRTKALAALAVAGAFALPASYAHDTNLTGSVSGEDATMLNAAPQQETMYYPDGTVVYHEGNVYLMDSPGSEPAIISSMDAENGSDLDLIGLFESESSPQPGWYVAQYEAPDVFLFVD